MEQNRQHRAFLQFVRRMLDLAERYSKEDLANFRDIARRDFPSVCPIIDEYLRMAERADSDAPLSPPFLRRPLPARRGEGQPMHLFDLLRDRRLFASNSDLAEFAGQILPNMSRHRFDKLSRGDIAARVIEYLETLDPRMRERLETSMRSALKSGTPKPSDRKSFFSKWEKIIKGIEL